MTTANETIIEWQRATGCENPEAAAAEIARLKDRLIEALEEVRLPRWSVIFSRRRIEEPEDDPLWHPVTPFSPPEFHTVYLYRAGDLDPAVGFRVEDGCETVWYHAEAGAECDDVHENRLIGHPAWKPTHYREIEADLPGRSETIEKLSEYFEENP